MSFGLTEFKLVFVVWADAHAGAGHWAELDEDNDEHLVRTCGFLIAVEDGGKVNHVTIAQSFSPDGFYDHVIYIPVGMVRNVLYLAEENQVA
jgi:hypothetical protein